MDACHLYDVGAGDNVALMGDNEAGADDGVGAGMTNLHGEVAYVLASHVLDALVVRVRPVCGHRLAPGWWFVRAFRCKMGIVTMRQRAAQGPPRRSTPLPPLQVLAGGAL